MKKELEALRAKVLNIIQEVEKTLKKKKTAPAISF